MSYFDKMKSVFTQETGLDPEIKNMTYLTWLQIKLQEEIVQQNAIIIQKLDNLSEGVKLK